MKVHNSEMSKKQLNYLLTLGTILMANKEIIEMVSLLREKHKINILESEWNPKYKEELEKSGKLEAIKKDIMDYLSESYIEDENENEGLRILTKCVKERKDDKAKDVWNEIWPILSMVIWQVGSNMLGEMSTEEALDSLGLSSILGDISADAIANFVAYDEIYELSPELTGGVVDMHPNYVFAIASPLTLQDDLLLKFKMAMRKKYPSVFRTAKSRVAAACLAYHNMGLSDEEIAQKLFKLNANSRNYKAELTKKENIVRKNRERIKKQLETIM